MNKLLMMLGAAAASTSLIAQGSAPPNWPAIEAETLKHFQAIVRMDSTDPPGGEKPVVDYLKQVLDAEGIPTQVFIKDSPNRPNLVARIKGNGKQRPLLLMGHTDTVNVDPKKWSHPPFSAERAEGFIYGRGTVDDKDNVIGTLMTMLMLKRLNIALDRDVIALFEAGEEGTSSLGIQFMVNEHYDAIEAEFCYAEGGSVTRVNGQVKYASVQTVEKIPRAITVTSRGVAGHGSVPLETNALAHLGEAVGKIAAWTPPMRINETTAAYFKRLASVSSPEEAKRYQDLLSPDPKISGPADAYMRKNEPRHWSMLRTSLSPTVITGGYRTNVIPSEGTATIDTRLAPDEDPAKFLELVRGVVNDPAVEVSYGAHSDQERILESELYRFVRFNWDAVVDLAKAK
jgi:acetylornithine deacetylase/succinyl-diaminopimelate desuccinylase-like protein